MLSIETLLKKIEESEKLMTPEQKKEREKLLRQEEQRERDIESVTSMKSSLATKVHTDVVILAIEQACGQGYAKGQRFAMELSMKKLPYVFLVIWASEWIARTDFRLPHPRVMQEDVHLMASDNWTAGRLTTKFQASLEILNTMGQLNG